MEIKFKRDTAFRKQFFVPESFAHPAKMDAQLLIWIVEHYSEVGETILDPMAGSGTTMLACTLGRDVVLVELEEKFCKMMRDNWEQVKMRPQLGSAMGSCKIIQGDARQLEGLADKIITSPPYSGSSEAVNKADRGKYQKPNTIMGKRKGTAGGFKASGIELPENPDNIANLPYGEVDKIVTSPPFAGNKGGLKSAEGFMYGDDNLGKRMMGGIKGGTGSHPDNIDSLPYGEIDKCIFSPPFAGNKGGLRSAESFAYGDDKELGKRMMGGIKGGTGESPDNIDRLPYGQIDKIVTSPPYEGMVTGHSLKRYDDPEYIKKLSNLPSGDYSTPGRVRTLRTFEEGYSVEPNNIGNLKSQSYLEAMLQVYQQCHQVLKPQGLMILVTKNFIRNKQVIRLDEDTIKLCEQAGFSFVERHYRKLPSLSFWRVTYAKKYPDLKHLIKQLWYEDILVFKK